MVYYMQVIGSEETFVGSFDTTIIYRNADDSFAILDRRHSSHDIGRCRDAHSEEGNRALGLDTDGRDRVPSASNS